jgi:nitrite reductase/ring-hydroxylating ferredoxin subunit
MTNRREFLKGLVVATGGLALLRSSNAFAKKLAIPLDKAEKLKTLGGSAVLKIKDMTILFIRDSETTIRALDPICTHLGCIVAYNSQAKRIDCPCHGSKFDLDGKVVHGPAAKPLKTYEASISEDRILIEV